MLRSQPWNYECSDCDSIESFYPCPIDNCDKHGDEIIRWTHTNCGGSFRLYENGKEKCEKCGTEDLFCLFNCHGSRKLGYVKTKAIFTRFLMSDTRDTKPFFFINLMLCIDKQYKDYPDKFN